MLKHISIRNFALIERVEVDFSAGFSVITGETGHGKSVFLGAISVLLGQRSDSGADLKYGAGLIFTALIGYSLDNHLVCQKVLAKFLLEFKTKGLHYSFYSFKVAKIHMYLQSCYLYFVFLHYI